MYQITVCSINDFLRQYLANIPAIFYRFDVKLNFIECEKVLKNDNSPEVVDLFLVEFTEKSIKYIGKLLKNNNIRMVLACDVGRLEENLKNKFSKIIQNEQITGWVDISLPLEMHFPFFRNLLNFQQVKKDLKQVVRIGNDLDKLVAHTLFELKRVKKLHEQIVPVRSENIRGLVIMSKYGAGEMAGGDFFDIIRGKNEIFLILTSASSYVTSSIVLSHFERLKKQYGLKGSIKSLKMDFLDQLVEELKSYDLINPKDGDPLKLFICRINLTELTIEGHHFGNIEFVQQKGRYWAGNEYPVEKEFFDRAHFRHKFTHKERMVLLSSGVRKDLNGTVEGQDLATYVRQNITMNPKELLNEIFYQLKHNSDEEFLNYDSSVIYLEVGSNVKVLV